MTPQRAQELEAELRRRAQKALDARWQSAPDESNGVYVSHIRLRGRSDAYREAADLVRDAAREGGVKMVIEEFEAEIGKRLAAWRAAYLQSAHDAPPDEDWPLEADFEDWWEWFAESDQMS